MHRLHGNTPGSGNFAKKFTKSIRRNAEKRGLLLLAKAWGCKDAEEKVSAMANQSDKILKQICIKAEEDIEGAKKDFLDWEPKAKPRKRKTKDKKEDVDKKKEDDKEEEKKEQEEPKPEKDLSALFEQGLRLRHDAYNVPILEAAPQDSIDGIYMCKNEKEVKELVEIHASSKNNPSSLSYL